jgi:DNA modification methylase
MQLKKIKAGRAVAGGRYSGSGGQMNMNRGSSAWERGLVRPSNVLNLPTEARNVGHPSPFPISLPTFFIKLLSSERDVVLDPFLGSGTTALAARMLGRRFVGIEQSEEFVETARKRLIRAAGQPPSSKKSKKLKKIGGFG